MTDARTRELRARFRALHADGFFAMPNAWDVGSARYLERLGFPAVATASAAVAWSLGLPDGAGRTPLAAVLDGARAIAAACDVPLQVDLESGYADDADGVHANVRACVATGAAGLSLEDSTGDAAQPLLPLEEAVARVRAARAAIDAEGGGALLAARAECFLVGHPDPLPETLLRLRAYAEAGADVLFAPGLASADEIRAVVDAARPLPVSVLLGPAMGMSLADLAALGVRRASVGPHLARGAWGGFMRAARELHEHGTLTSVADAPGFGELNALGER